MRSAFRMSDLNRIVSACRQRKKEKERIALINAQGGNCKELKPTYTLQNVIFNDVTRMAKIEFIEEQTYRTVVRYVTQNYVKYPIYSSWKTKTKTITKNIKLTNAELERLNCNNDFLIREFAKDIIVALNNKELLPSWFLIECLKSEFQEKIDNIETQFFAYNSSAQTSIKTYQCHITKNQTELKANNELLIKKQNILQKLQNKLIKIESYKPSIIKSVFTLFVYNYLKSSKRKAKITALKEKSQTQIVYIQKVIEQNNVCIEGFTKRIAETKSNIELKRKETENLKEKEHLYFNEKLNQVIPLTDTYVENSDFVSLKALTGYSYIKIIGCYVIRNKVNHKCYVGQSKDVLKRIRQHFKGTVPSNAIFAEDYYLTSKDERDNLFEVKIIKCLTKDELDRTEKQLIFDYEAFTKGYNGTNGNK